MENWLISFNVSGVSLDKLSRAVIDIVTMSNQRCNYLFVYFSAGYFGCLQRPQLFKIYYLSKKGYLLGCIKSLPLKKKKKLKKKLLEKKLLLEKKQVFLKN